MDFDRFPLLKIVQCATKICGVRSCVMILWAYIALPIQLTDAQCSPTCSTILAVDHSLSEAYHELPLYVTNFLNSGQHRLNESP